MTYSPSSAGDAAASSAPSPADAPSDPGLVDMLCFAVYSTGHAFNRVYKPLLDAIGLTYPQYLAMVALWARDDRTVKDLGEDLFLDSSTLTPLLKRLERLGHIQRSRDPRDERLVRIRLTAKGRALRQTADAIPGCIFDATSLTPEAIGRLTQEMNRLRRTLLGR